MATSRSFTKSRGVFAAQVAHRERLPITHCFFGQQTFDTLHPTPIREEKRENYKELQNPYRDEQGDWHPFRQKQ
jgi:hypothetical protein